MTVTDSSSCVRKSTRVSKKTEKVAGQTLRKKRSVGYSRWGKSQDQKAFKILRTYAESIGADTNDLSKINFNNPDMKNLFVSIMNECKWASKLCLLIQRLARLCKSKVFSVRELKQLRSLCAKKKFDVSRSDVLEFQQYFPGKTTQDIVNRIEQGFDCIKCRQ